MQNMQIYAALHSHFGGSQCKLYGKCCMNFGVLTNMRRTHNHWSRLGNCVNESLLMLFALSKHSERAGCALGRSVKQHKISENYPIPTYLSAASFSKNWGKCCIFCFTLLFWLEFVICVMRTTELLNCNYDLSNFSELAVFVWVYLSAEYRCLPKISSSCNQQCEICKLSSCCEITASVRIWLTERRGDWPVRVPALDRVGSGVGTRQACSSVSALLSLLPAVLGCVLSCLRCAVELSCELRLPFDFGLRCEFAVACSNR